MRWRAKPPPIDGDRLVVTRFAWWPRRVRGLWIWLEAYWSLIEFSIVAITFWGMPGAWVELSRHLTRPELVRDEVKE